MAQTLTLSPTLVVHCTTSTT